jgi:hypothetical protein
MSFALSERFPPDFPCSSHPDLSLYEETKMLQQLFARNISINSLMQLQICINRGNEKITIECVQSPDFYEWIKMSPTLMATILTYTQTQQTETFVTSYLIHEDHFTGNKDKHWRQSSLSHRLLRNSAVQTECLLIFPHFTS